MRGRPLIPFLLLPIAVLLCLTACGGHGSSPAPPASPDDPKETEETETVRVLRFAGWEINRTQPSFGHYRITDMRTVSVSPLAPVYIDLLTAREIGFFERTLSEEEAFEIALSRARETAHALVPRDAAIINTYGTIRMKNGERLAEAIVTAEETIGRTEENPHDG